jgi:16S rRNA (uracil1498-N3)-methyltransferase
VGTSGPLAPTTPESARALVFVDDLARAVLDEGDHHHLARVLRVPPGADIVVGDGAGSWRPARFTGDPEVVPTGDVVHEPAPRPALTVAFALVKGERPDLVVQKLTELGVDRIAPFVAARSVVRWDDAKAARQLGRWREIARLASMQCRRTHLPDVMAMAAFAEVAELPGAALADPGGVPPSLAHPTVLVGPEGGWTDDERGCGVPAVAIATHVLRSETAAITSGALLTGLRGHLVTETSTDDRGW